MSSGLSSHPAQHQRERDQTEVSLRLATTSGEEDQLCRRAVLVGGVSGRRDIEKQKRELEQTPMGFAAIRRYVS